jgi:Kef-type K+ transport system membrane component KefB
LDDILGSIVSTLSNILSPHGPAVSESPTSFAPGDYSIHFFLQLCVILLTCRVVGIVGQRFLGQPQVIGEMVAGVILGPSVVGLVFPELQGAIFPKETKAVLYAGSPLGVGLDMFLVGTTLQTGHFKAKAKSEASVSFAGIVAPFLIAVMITPGLLTIPGLFTAGISQTNATLFVGACVALTAFPMLARTLNEHGLANTSLGTLSLTAGAFDDAVSWCVLAVALATISGGIRYAAMAGPLFEAVYGRKPRESGELGGLNALPIAKP